MPNAGFSEILQVISLAGAAVLALRLFTTGLWRQYPVFFWYFVFRVPNTLWPLFVPNNGSSTYQHLYILTEPFSWVFHVLVVVELSRLVLNQHRGIYSLLRWAMYGSVVFAIGLSIVSLLPRIKPTMTKDTQLMGYWFATQRGIDFSLAIFILLILFFLSRYPVRLKRNILVHAAIYTIFFFGGALTMFLRTFVGRSSAATSTANTVLALLSITCIFAWVVFLSPQGEAVKAAFPRFSSRYEEHALRQLDALNATLLKVSRK